MISVAMAVYNGEKYIAKQLDSIVNQTMAPTEIVITDDSDNEDTYNIIKKYIEKYKNIKWIYIKNEARLGYCKNFFKAINETTGDIIFLSDQDDIWELDKIEKMSKCISDNKSIKCLCAKYVYIDKDDNVISGVHEYSTSANYKNNVKSKKCFLLDKKEFFKILAFPGMCFAITKQLKNELLDFLKNANVDDVKYHDLLISYLAARTNSFYIYNEVLCKYRMHGDNAIGVDLYNNKGKQDRIEWMEGLVERQEKLLSYERSVICDDENIDILEKLIDFNNDRIKCLKERNLFKVLSLWRFKDGYLSIKSYFGDMYYILRIL